MHPLTAEPALLRAGLGGLPKSTMPRLGGCINFSRFLGRTTTDRGQSLRRTLALAVCCPLASFAPSPRVGGGCECWLQRPEDPWGTAPGALQESVDGWPMAITVLKTLGGRPKPVAALGRDGRLGPSSRGVYAAVGPGAVGAVRSYLCGGSFLGELSGGNWMVRV